jgi:hypothetical protein
LSRGVLALYTKTLNKSLGLIYLFLERCNSKYNVQGFFLIKNLLPKQYLSVFNNYI